MRSSLNPFGLHMMVDLCAYEAIESVWGPKLAKTFFVPIRLVPRAKPSS